MRGTDQPAIYLSLYMDIPQSLQWWVDTVTPLHARPTATFLASVCHCPSSAVEPKYAAWCCRQWYRQVYAREMLVLGNSWQYSWQDLNPRPLDKSDALPLSYRASQMDKWNLCVNMSKCTRSILTVIAKALCGVMAYKRGQLINITQWCHIHCFR